MTDGALVVVDVADGASAQTETVLRQALRERVTPVLMLNKVDRLLLQKQFTPEQVYARFIEVIEQVLKNLARYRIYRLTSQSLSLHPTTPHHVLQHRRIPHHFTSPHYTRRHVRPRHITQHHLLPRQATPSNTAAYRITSHRSKPPPSTHILLTPPSPTAVCRPCAQVNTLIEQEMLEHGPDQAKSSVLLSLEAGNVAFGSGYFQWAATLDSFVTRAAPNATVEERAEMRHKLAKRKNFVSNVLSPIFK
jgi:translation elongation factor EF-G